MHPKTIAGKAAQPVRSPRRSDGAIIERFRRRRLTSRTFLLGVLVVAAHGLFAQSPPSGEFEVADVKVNHSRLSGNDYFTIRPGGVFVAQNARVAELFQYAFKVRRRAIVNAPNWFDDERVDVTAKSAPGTSNDQIRVMVQTLLVQKFKVALHIEQRNMNAFVLVLAKGGPKLQKSIGAGEGDCERAVEPGASAGVRHLACTHMTISQLADGLPDLAPTYIDKPVVDHTGLTAPYDFALDWTPKKVDDVGELTIFVALEKLGLRIQQQKVLLPAIVLDNIERLPQT